jgi:hypothetical protein
MMIPLDKSTSIVVFTTEDLLGIRKRCKTARTLAKFLRKEVAQQNFQNSSALFQTLRKNRYIQKSKRFPCPALIFNFRKELSTA